jgi:hypothetical protein
VNECKALYVGLVPVRRKDLGWSILGFHVYVFFSWYRIAVTGGATHLDPKQPQTLNLKP